MKEELALLISALLISTFVLLTFVLTLVKTGPIPQYALLQREHLAYVGNFEEIGKKVGRFLWEHRSLDLFIQAFVIFSTLVCCLAMLRK